MSEVIILGITGPSGSGKSSLISEIRSKYPKTFIHYIQMDHYYNDHKDVSVEARAALNYDAPESLDISLFIKHITALKQGHAIKVPQYDFTAHARTHETMLVPPAPIVVLDGILLLAISEVRDLIHHKVFLDTPLDLCLLRRITRDCLERGRCVESVIRQYSDSVRPMLFKHVLPSKEYANTILPMGGIDPYAINVLHGIVEGLIEKYRLDPNAAS